MADYLNNFSLEGKVALVTGASYGIGFAIAKAMAGAGATIVFNDIKQELVDKGIAAYKEEGIKAQHHHIRHYQIYVLILQHGNSFLPVFRSKYIIFTFQQSCHKLQ